MCFVWVMDQLSLDRRGDERTSVLILKQMVPENVVQLGNFQTKIQTKTTIPTSHNFLMSRQRQKLIELSILKIAQ